MIRFLADIIYLFFFLTLTAPLYPLFNHWNKTGQSHRRSAMAQRMVMNAFHICLHFAGVKVIVDGKEKIPPDTAVLYVGNHSSYYDILCSYIATVFLPKRKCQKFHVCGIGWNLSTVCFLTGRTLKKGLKQ